MLHYEFKIEFLKRHLPASSDDWKDIAIEIFQKLTALHSDYDRLRQEQNIHKRNKKYPKVQLPYFINKKQLGKSIESFSKAKHLEDFALAIQRIEQLQSENKELQEVINQVGLVIIDALPEMSASTVKKLDKLIDKMTNFLE